MGEGLIEPRLVRDGSVRVFRFVRHSNRQGLLSGVVRAAILGACLSPL